MIAGLPPERRDVAPVITIRTATGDNILSRGGTSASTGTFTVDLPRPLTSIWGDPPVTENRHERRKRAALRRRGLICVECDRRPSTDRVEGRRLCRECVVAIFKRAGWSFR